MYVKYFTIFFLVFYSTQSIFAQEINPNGFNQFFYPNGKLSSEGKMLNGQPEGYWKTYFESGKLKSEGNRKNHLLDSIWKFYSEEGVLIKEINYEKNKKEGLSIEYSIEGKVTAKEYFTDNLRQGWSYYYFPDGKLKEKIKYANDKPEGISYEYSPEGQIISETEYLRGYVKSREKINRKDSKGQKQGLWKEYYPCNDTCSYERVKTEGRYKDDKKDGYFREYDYKGVLLSTTKYKDGKVEENPEELSLYDIKTEYYENATVKAVKSYKNGKPDGVFKAFDRNGNIINSEIYREGNKTGEGVLSEKGIKQGPWKEYYIDGTLRAEGEYENGLKKGEWKFYHPNGKMEQTGKYITGEKPHGRWVWYYSDGKLLREEIFRNGKEDGELIEYSDRGKIITKGEYIEGEKEGFWVYEIGDFREEGIYKSGKKDELWKSYYSDTGELAFEGKYIDGTPDGKHIYYYPNGKKQLEGKYEFSHKEGDWKRYDDTGNLLITIFYKNGIEIKIDGIKLKPKHRIGEENITETEKKTD
jgi:uncharacterized protein